MLLATGSTGRCHTFCNLFTLQLMCEKDVGMGLCTFNFVKEGGTGIIVIKKHLVALKMKWFDQFHNYIMGKTIF